MTQPLNSSELTSPADYDSLDLHQLEAELAKIQQQSNFVDSTPQLSRLYHAIRQRQRKLKAQVMQFEQTNSQYLLVFDSTNHFAKLAGHSVIFFAGIIADRIGHRYNLQKDTDHYSRSPEGIISFQDLERLTRRLTEINIFLDHSLSTNELHFYKLPRPYTSEQVTILRRNIKHDRDAITKIILPESPNPLLYVAIREISRIIYYDCRNISEPLAKATFVPELISHAEALSTYYLNHANHHSTNPGPNHTLQQIFLENRRLRATMANVQALGLFPAEHVTTLLEHIITVERLTKREYLKSLEESKAHTS